MDALWHSFREVLYGSAEALVRQECQRSVITLRMRLSIFKEYIHIITISEVFPIQDSIAFPQNFVSFDSKVEVLTQIAHIKQFFVVLLKQTE